MRRTQLGLCLFLGSTTTAIAESSPTQLRQSLQSVTVELELARAQSAKDLHRVLREAASDEERMTAARQLGAYYATRQQGLALHLLSLAKSRSEAGAERDEISYYLTQTYFNSGAYASALHSAESLLEQRQLQREVRRELYRMLLLSAAVEGRTELFSKTFAAYEKEVPNALWHEDVVAAAARLVAAAAIEDKAYSDLLENLAQNYPITAISRQAYKRLVELSNESIDAKPRYIFSLNLLTRIYANRELEEGLGAACLARLESPLRYGEGSGAIRLGDLEKVFALHRLKAWPEARDLSLKILAQTELEMPRRQQALRLLAISLTKLGAHRESAKVYEGYFKELNNPNEPETIADRESLARVQNLQGDYKGAAQSYAKLAKQSSKPQYRWLHFWNLYLAHDNTAALRLLQEPGYVQPLDTEEPVLAYWRARILERSGQKKAAAEAYAAIVAEYPAGFYGMVLASRASRSTTAQRGQGAASIRFASIESGEVMSTLSLPRYLGQASDMYGRFLEPLASAVGVEKFALLSIMRAESQFNPAARSPVGAVGLMQIMPATGYQIARLLDDSHFDIYRLADPMTNMAYGAFYYSHLVTFYSGNYVLATAAYNAGPMAVNQWLKACSTCEIDEFVESIPYKETRRYVKKVMRFYGEYRRNQTADSDLNLLEDDLPQTLPSGYPVF